MSLERPWEDEDDLVTFTSHGLSCAIVRQPDFKSLCGYVRVPDDHPLAYIHSNYLFTPEPVTLEAEQFEVHGGVTFMGLAAGLRSNPFGKGRCWAIGFDAAHGGDLVPGIAGLSEPGFGNVYRDVPYMIKQCERLAQQIADVKTNMPNRIWQKLSCEINSVLADFRFGSPIAEFRAGNGQIEQWTSLVLVPR